MIPHRSSPIDKIEKISVFTHTGGRWTVPVSPWAAPNKVLSGELIQFLAPLPPAPLVLIHNLPPVPMLTHTCWRWAIPVPPWAASYNVVPCQLILPAPLLPCSPAPSPELPCLPTHAGGGRFQCPHGLHPMKLFPANSYGSLHSYVTLIPRCVNFIVACSTLGGRAHLLPERISSFYSLICYQKGVKG